MARQIEIFSAGCFCCARAIEQVRSIRCPSCELHVLNMSEALVADRARQLGIKHVPTVVVDGKLVECCKDGGVSEEALRRAGIGVPG